jgi:hypothetical protein
VHEQKDGHLTMIYARADTEINRPSAGEKISAPRGQRTIKVITTYWA